MAAATELPAHWLPTEEPRQRCTLPPPHPRRQPSALPPRLTFMNDSSMPIFLEEQGMCTAMLSRTCAQRAGRAGRAGAGMAQQGMGGTALCAGQQREDCRGADRDCGVTQPTCLNSSLSSRKWRMNSTGSYSENLRGGGGKRLRQLLCATYRRCFSCGTAAAVATGPLPATHRSAGSDRLDLIWARQGEVSHTMGHLPAGAGGGRRQQQGSQHSSRPKQ